MRFTSELALALTCIVAGFLFVALALGSNGAGHHGSALMFFTVSALLMIGTLSWAVIRIAGVVAKR